MFCIHFLCFSFDAIVRLYAFEVLSVILNLLDEIWSSVVDRLYTYMKILKIDGHGFV